MIRTAQKHLLEPGASAFANAISSGLYQALAEFAYPLISALTGSTTGAGFLLAALSDVMLCAQERTYGAMPTQVAQALTRARFGHTLSPSVYREHQGADLPTLGWSGRVVAANEVLSHALQLAQTLSNKPASSLRLLKQHLVRHLPAQVEPLSHVQPTQPTQALLTLCLSEYSAAQLAEQLTLINQHAYRGVILTDSAPTFASAFSADDVLNLQHAIQACALPVVAAVTGDANGIGMLLSQCCDAALYASSGIYRNTP